MNVDIFACINFRVFTQISIFAWIQIRFFRLIASLGYNLGYNKSIILEHIFWQLFKKLENMYSANISIFTVYKVYIWTSTDPI